jgi:hypothetical protein
MLSESAMEVSIISSRHDADWLLDFPLRLGFVVHAAAIVEATNLSFQSGKKVSVNHPQRSLFSLVKWEAAAGTTWQGARSETIVRFAPGMMKGRDTTRCRIDRSDQATKNEHGMRDKGGE